MKFLITGATGDVGSRVVEQLTERGERPRVFVRDLVKAQARFGDLSGTGVTVTQVCPGPVESEFDQVTGSPGGMIGTPPRFFRITAAQCAREALAGFERGEARVFPGRGYRFVMKMLPLFPLWMRRKQAANIAVRLRAEQISAR